MTDAVFVCFGDPTECWNCGGSTWAWAVEHRWRALWRRLRRQRLGEGGGRFCSTDCEAEQRWFAARENARWRAWFGCCRFCGFDRRQHDIWCPRAVQGAC